ncbi:MAG: MerR family transcriptional regulator [Pyrinomonadaceae bacterium]|nr:MerR family transcriptional regulator [Pyrinomonadaceae bacterium]
MAQTKVVIPEKIFFKIGEVCDLVDVQAHVLRYWETEFPMLSPKKNRSGQRTYRRRDVEIALRIKDLLYEELYTIAGAKKRLQTEMRGGSKAAEKLSQAKGETGSLFDGMEESAGNGGSADPVELNDERKEALKTLTAQLLELREMMKTNQTLDSEKGLSSDKLV